MTDATVKTYPLNLTSRIILFVSGGMLTAFLIFLLNIPTSKTLSNGIRWSILFFIGFGLLSIYCSLTSRLILSSEGIRYYFIYPFSLFMLWKDVFAVSQNESGMVNLKLNPHRQKTGSQLLIGNQLQISAFIDDWQSNELAAELQRHAVQLQIPSEIFTQPKLKLWQRPGFMLAYYVLSFIPLILSISLMSIDLLKPVKFSLYLAYIGYEGGIFGGMLSLRYYSKWLKLQTDKKFQKKISRTASWNYVLPYSGWCIAFLIGLVAQGTTLGWYFKGDVTGLNAICLLAGVFQASFLPYMKLARRNE